MEYISLACNILFAVLILIGLIFGVVRGVKKSSYRLLIFAVCAIVGGLLTPLLTKQILNISVSFNGTYGTLNELIASKLSSIPEISEIIANSPSFAGLIEKAPEIVVNLVSFLILFLLFWLIGYIIYQVLSATALKNVKVTKKAVANVSGAAIEMAVKPKKRHRLMGGLVGMVNSFLFIFMVFIPVFPLINTFNELSYQSEVVAESNPSPTAKLLNDYIPKEVLDIFHSVGNSAFKVSNMGAIGDSCFDALTTINVEGESFVIRKEINTVSEIYNDIAFLLKIQVGTNINLRNLDFDKLERAINNLFDSGTYRMLAKDLVPYYLKKYSNIQGIPAEYAELVTEFINEVADRISLDKAKGLKSDIMSVFNIFKTLCTSGVLDLAASGSNVINISDYLALITQNGNRPVKEIISSIFDSSIVKKSLVFAGNIGLEYLEKFLKVSTPLGRIDESKVDFNSLKDDALSFLTATLDAMQAIDANGYNPDNIIRSKSYRTFIPSVFDALEILKNSTMFKATTNDQNIFENLMVALNSSEYGKYYDFTLLNTTDMLSKQGPVVVSALDFCSEILDVATTNKKFTDIKYSDYQLKMQAIASSEIFAGIKPGLIDYLKNTVGPKNKYVEAIFSGFDETNIATNIKEILLATMDATEVLGASGILDMAMDGNIYIYDLLNGLKAQGQQKIDDTLSKALEIKPNQNIMVLFYNDFIDNYNASKNATIPHISNTNFTLTSQELSSIITDIFSVTDEIVKLDANLLQKNLFFILNSDTDLLYDGLGNILEKLANLSFFKDATGSSTIRQILSNEFKVDCLNLNFVNLTSKLKPTFNMLRDMNLLSLFTPEKGLELTSQRIPEMVEYIAKSFNGSTITLDSLIGGLIDDEAIFEILIKPYITQLKENVTLTNFIDFDIMLNKTELKSDLNKLGTVLHELASRNMQNNKSYLSFLLSNQDLAVLIENLTYEGANNDIDAIFTPLISTKALKPLIATLLNNVVTSAGLSATIPDLKTINISEQASEITDSLKKMLAVYNDIKLGFDYATINKTNLANLMNSLKQNAYRNVIDPTLSEGIFKGIYNGFLDKIKSDPTIGARVTAVLNEYTQGYNVNYDTLIALVDAVNNSGNTFTEDVKQGLLRVVFDMKQNTSVTNVVKEILKAADIIMSIQGDLSPLKNLNTALEPYRTEMIGDKNVVDYTIDMLVNITGFEEINILKQLDTVSMIADLVAGTPTAENITGLVDKIKNEITEDPTLIEDAIKKVSDGGIKITVPEEAKTTIENKLSEITNENIRNDLRVILGLNGI